MTTTAYLTTKQVAVLLSIHITTVTQLAKAGKLPAFKVGRRWKFAEIDLLAFARSQYRGAMAVGGERSKDVCHFTDGKIASFGGSVSRRQTAKKYADLLAPKTGSKRKNGTTGQKQNYGESTNSATSLRLIGKTP
ncbi:MAG: helix-turn-helix domain-containing protein [Burkholderiales bacterium]|nr:helix-turn-helix domain-containing protein [Burkholderiales bacterium]